MNKEKFPSVVFVSLNAYPLFDRSVHVAVGGMETRSVLFAKALAQTGRWKTIFAVGDFAQKEPVSAGDVNLVVYRPLAKWVRDNVVPRFLKHKWRPVIHLDMRDIHFIWQLPVYLLMSLFPQCLVNRFWQSIRPGVVCCFGNNPTSAEVIADCYRSGIKTVLCIASDSDLSSDYVPGDPSLNDYGTPCWMGWYAVNTVDYVFVQTERQRKLLKQNFSRDGAIVRNPVEVTAEARLTWSSRDAREFVLWVGRSDTFHKRPQLLLDVARRCPDMQFLMILNKTNAGVFDTIQRQRPGNVTIIERVKHHEIWEFYRRARVFVSTSAYEGFPNTFLQAAVSGVPVVSLSVDPDGMLAAHHCGICSNDDFDGFVQSVRTLWTDRGAAEVYAGNFFEYVLSHHALQLQTERFEALLDEVLAAPLPDSVPNCWHSPFTRFVHRDN